MTTGRFHGAFTALVTPFKNGKIDEEAYREFIEWQIEQGIDGLVPWRHHRRIRHDDPRRA